MRLAEQLIESASAVGADAVKFQSFIASEEISVHAEKALYQVAQTGDQESQLRWFPDMNFLPNSRLY